jgi:hypothetical protein
MVQDVGMQKLYFPQISYVSRGTHRTALKMHWPPVLKIRAHSPSRYLSRDAHKLHIFLTHIMEYILVQNTLALETSILLRIISFILNMRYKIHGR